MKQSNRFRSNYNNNKNKIQQQQLTENNLDK